MPLSDPVPREPLHTRTIEIVGYRRQDGLFDIEAVLTDTKAYSFTLVDRGEVTPGTPLHRMLARMTVDQDFLIHAFEATTELGPYRICPEAAPNFASLAGLTIGRGFIKAANERIGGVKGCTHLRELLGQMGTVALQSLMKERQAKGPNPAVLNTCLAWREGGEVARRNFPERYASAGA